MKVYLVMGFIEYEGHTVIDIKKTKYSAEKVVKEIKEYKRGKPKADSCEYFKRGPYPEKDIAVYNEFSIEEFDLND